MADRLPLAAAVAALAACADRLGSSADFARKLVHEHAGRGLTAKQADWVYRLLDRAEGREAPPVAVGDVAPLLALFARARAAGLRHPKIRLATADGLPVVLALAGERAKVPGSITVTDGGGFEAGRYFGRVLTSGALDRGRDCSPAVVKVLTDLAADPAGTAAIHGRREGWCCFCARGLVDGRSVAVGYGPVCAEKFGLPWGEETEPPVVITPTEVTGG